MAETLRYDGSIPVPPCHENIKYLVLGQAWLLECLEDCNTLQKHFAEAATSPYLEAIPVLRDQAKALEETLRCWAGGVSGTCPSRCCQPITVDPCKPAGGKNKRMPVKGDDREQKWRKFEELVDFRYPPPTLRG